MGQRLSLNHKPLCAASSSFQPPHALLRFFHTIAISKQTLTKHTPISIILGIVLHVSQGMKIPCCSFCTCFSASVKEQETKHGTCKHVNVFSFSSHDLLFHHILS